MKIAQFAVELRRRALMVPEFGCESFDEIVTQLGVMAHSGKASEADAVRRILVALTHADHDNDLSPAILDSLGPESLRRLEALVIALLDGRYTTKELRDALRPVLLRSVK